jgi:hypothetical protein
VEWVLDIVNSTSLGSCLAPIASKANQSGGKIVKLLEGKESFVIKQAGSSIPDGKGFGCTGFNITAQN